ncbi:hypothetical protein H5410_010798 [Solanum commersonii]|uniref:Plastid lipid-associated protein/fibrillin conserved domain-containing protein n=1 Tax=Solanum commersonii TaxID=4109 RepID=A0A9J6AMJ5_SOLCO|nr:hypothetical protein H5410_010798 [Solanum commersonii]
MFKKGSSTVSYYKRKMFPFDFCNKVEVSFQTYLQATANLVPLNARRVAVKFDSFTIASLISIKNRGSGRGELEITYLDEELRISRGNQGNLFILRMVDPSYRVPL